MIIFSCLHCVKALRVNDELAGKMVKCPGCQNVFAVPASSDSLKAAPTWAGTVEPVAGGSRDLSAERTILPKVAPPALDSDAASSFAGQSSSEVIPPPLMQNAPPPSWASPPGGPSASPVHAAAAQRFRTIRPHARGGLGEVFVAMDEELQREVALKEILAEHADDGDCRVRFLREAEVTGRLEHPGIVPVYGLGVYPDRRPFYTMRFIKGESLQQALNRFHAADQPGRCPEQRRLELHALLRRFLDVCNALAYAHSKGVLHRDLKPENIMLGPFGETLVVDWGLAKILGKTDGPAPASVFRATVSSSATATQPGTIAGTVPFMSPEQAAGAVDDLTPVSDVYGLGAVLYCLVAGRPPFVQRDLHLLLKAVIGGAIRPPRQVKPSVPRELEAICLKAMALRPEDRYGSAKELAAEVEHWLADEPVTAYREPLPARVRRWGRRHRGWVAAAAALALTATAALAVGLGLVNAEKNRTAEEERKTKAALVLVTEEQKKTQAALRAETTAKEQAQAAEKSAAEQRQLALKTVRGVVDDIHAELKDRPALKELRKKLLKKALDGLKEVARAADTVQQADHATIWVHRELGDVFANIDGNLEQAKKQYQLAFDLAQRLAAADPSNAVAQGDLAAAYERIGDVQRRQGDGKAALASFQEGLKIDQKITAADPSNAAEQRRLAIFLELIGNVQLEFQGDSKAALASYQESLRICQKLADADPSKAVAQRDLIFSYRRIGQLQLEVQRDTKAALVSYQKGLKICQKLVDADPSNATVQLDLSDMHGRVAAVQVQQGDTKAALASFQEALKISQKMADADPSHFRTQAILSSSLNGIGDMQLRKGDGKAALASFQAALKIHRKLADADPSNTFSQKSVADSHAKIGGAQLKQGDGKAALASYQEALKIDQKRADADPKNAIAQSLLACSHISLGAVQFQQKDLKAALASFQEALQIDRKLADADPSNAATQSRLSTEYMNLGVVLENQGDLKAALASHQEALKICQKLADADPSDAQAQEGLFNSFFNLGDVAQLDADFGKAIVWNQKALGVVKGFAHPEYFAAADIRKLEDRLRLCRGAEMILQDPAAIQKLAAADRPSVLNAVMLAHIRRKAPDKAMAAADLIGEHAKKPNDFYDAACGYARCVPLTDKLEDKERYAARAVALLKQAVAKGYKDAAQLKKDAALDALRDRADFKALMKELEAKP